MSVELHPPIDEDKGTALRRLAAARRGPVLFMGDDVGDLTAFDLLDELAAAGRDVRRVAVDSPEVPGELRTRADLVVDGPAGAVELLRGLLG
jgi:trehalose 6-phosphate phosphatase